MHIKKLNLLLIALLLLMVSLPAGAQDGWRNADELFRAMQIGPGSWVADIGSREGYYTTRMAPLVGEAGRIFAVDIDADALGDLHENLREEDIRNVTPVYSMPDNPMLPDGTLDAVLIRNTYHEFTEHMAMLGHIRRAMKLNGRLVIAEPISNDLQDASRERQASSHDIALRYVREDLRQAGFEILEVVDPFTESQRGQHYWMLIAVKAEGP